MEQINEKSKFKELKEYIENNGYQKLYVEKKNKPIGRSKKSDLLEFIKEQEEIKQVENSVDTIFGDTIQTNPEELCEPRLDQESDIQKDDDIEEIPVFKREQSDNRDLQSKIGGFSVSDNIRLNNTQFKVKAYISRFPDKLKSITSRSTFKQEFSKLKDPITADSKEAEGKTKEEINQINESNQALLLDIKRELGQKNSSGLIKDTVFTTVSVIEKMFKIIRENKDNKFPPILVSTLGSVNLDGLSAVLDARPEFHDCLDELLIEYSTYDNFFSSLSAEKRLLLIILGSAVMVNHINQTELAELKNKKINPKDPKLRDP